MRDDEFGCIVADPPWRYIEPGLWRRQSSQANKEYQTMSIDDICRLPVPASDDAYLWLWITNRHLAYGAGRIVCEAWGFRPITVMTWCKPQIGLGYYLRNATEHLVLAVRGSPGQFSRTNVASWFIAPRTRHSMKPADLYDTVRSLSDGPFLELFARNGRSGWTTWGNEVGDPLNIGFDPENWPVAATGKGENDGNSA